MDRWIVYGRIEGRQDFSAKELTVDPGTSCTIQDSGAYSLTVVQGGGKMNDLVLDCPKMIGFRELTRDEVFCSAKTAAEGVRYENTSPTEPLVILRYYGPEANPDAPAIGDA